MLQKVFLSFFCGFNISQAHNVFALEVIDILTKPRQTGRIRPASSEALTPQRTSSRHDTRAPVGPQVAPKAARRVPTVEVQDEEKRVVQLRFLADDMKGIDRELQSILPSAGVKIEGDMHWALRAEQLVETRKSIEQRIRELGGSVQVSAHTIWHM